MDSKMRMKPEKAVEILNRLRHNDADGYYMTDRGTVEDGHGDFRYTEFEAVAIAEKYATEWPYSFIIFGGMASELC